ncbi:MAG: hypothetical protein JO128_19950 [Alphaproteobacteria bacterium]|nr:hypothetical protein [Alphaproteobacteria bacterium]
MRLAWPTAFILALGSTIPAAHAQLRSAVPAAPMHTPMPSPSTAAPPIGSPATPVAPSASVLPPSSPISPAEPIAPQHTPAPAPAVVPPPIVMMPPNLLSPAQLPPGVQPDSTTPTVPIPAGTPIGPPHP